MKKYVLVILPVLLVIYSLHCITALSSENSESTAINQTDTTEEYETETSEADLLWDNIEIDFDGMAPDIARIIERGELIVALPVADTPVFHESDGQGGMKGIDIDLAESIATALGVEVVFNRTTETFAQLTDRLKCGEADLIISTYSMTTNRSMYVNFSDPYLEAYLSIMVGKQNLVRYKIESDPVDYMKNNPVTIGAEAGTAYCDIAQALFPRAIIVPIENYVDGCNMVASGELFAFLSVEFAFLEILERDPGMSLYVSVYSFTDMKDQFAIGVSRDTPQLLNFVNTFLRTNREITRQMVESAFKERFGGEIN